MILFFTVFAAIDFFLWVGEDEYMIQPLFNGCDTSRILAADDVGNLLWKMQAFLGYNLRIFDEIDGDVVVNKAQHIKIQGIGIAFHLQDILCTHFAAAGIADDGYRVVRLIQMEVAVQGKTGSGPDVIQHIALRNSANV